MSRSSLTATIGSLFGLVSTTAESVSKTVNVATSAIDVASFHADAWRETAKHQAHYDKQNAQKIGKSRAAQKLTNHRIEVLSLCQNAQYAELYTAAMKELIDLEEEVSQE